MPDGFTAPPEPEVLVIRGTQLVSLLGRFTASLEGRVPSRRLWRDFSGPFAAIPVKAATRLGVGNELTLLRRFGLSRSAEVSSYPREQLLMAARSALVGISRRPGVMGQAAVKALLAGVARLDEGLVVSVPRVTVLRSAQRDLIATHLREWGYPDVGVPRDFRWERPEEPGISFAPPLFQDPESGTVIMPLFAAPGVRIPEHVHPGQESLVVLSGALEDERGVVDSTRLLAQPAGRVHAPTVVGDRPVVFVRVSRGGTVSTGLRGQIGTDLIRSFFETRDELIASYLRGIPPDREGRTTQRDLIQSLFFYLRLLDPANEDDKTEARWFLTATRAAGPEDRLATVRSILRGGRR